jgi:predicted SprT family Zn-dependent metalloprotease
LALSLIKEYCPDFRFRFNNTKRLFGQCRNGQKLILLSRHLVELNGEEQVRDTILHEIAHALTPGHHHDKVWKAKAKELGCRPSRCYSNDSVVVPRGAYALVCPNCGFEYQVYKRRRSVGACRKCCVKYSNGKYNDRFELKLKRNL